MEIKNVIICGLGSLGVVYANQLNEVCNLKILADNDRINFYKKKPVSLNGKFLNLSYITPESEFLADLIIITTKFNGLNSAISYIKNFIKKDTIVLSLLNGISSEDLIKSAYPELVVPRAYYIGHSAIKKGFDVIHDGVGKIVIESNSRIESFFEKNNINFEVSNNIIYDQWVKLGVNIVLNELTALFRCTIGELRGRSDYSQLSESIINEVKLVAEYSNVSGLENYINDVYSLINLVADDGITSMYQDILSNRKTEVDIFSGEILKLGELYDIATPINLDLYNKIKLVENSIM
jgi:2-dehydropantoate 2-reductase